MAGQLNPERIHYLSFEEGTSIPSEGTWEVYADRWWVFSPDKGFVFYGKSPQCNRSQRLTEIFNKQLGLLTIPLFVERVYIRHDCADYR